VTLPVSAIGARLAAATATGTRPGGPAQAPDALGKDAFLKLLVAQLKYQNPMSPMDGADFLAQTAQFNMLEKLAEIAEQGKQLAADDSSRTAASMLGRKVTYTDKDGNEAAGVVTGARFDPAGAVLLVGDTTVPLSSVTQVALAA
jgi:flagellar basal-body rod modification protein FlgD